MYSTRFPSKTTPPRYRNNKHHPSGERPERYKKYRKCLFGAIFFLSLSWLFLTWFLLRQELPDEIRLTRGEDKSLEEIFGLPFLTFDEAFPASQGQKAAAECKIFDLIPLKEIEIEIVEPEHVLVSGSTVGIYMEMEGVLIVDTQEIKGMDGLYYQPAKNIVKSGDYITACNDMALTSKQDLVEAVKNCSGEDVSLSVIRDGKSLELSLSPVECGEEEYKLGIWVRDDTQGIGTLTYIDEAGNFGALGHGISDIDTGGLLKIKKGTLYETQILSIQKGSRGTPGEIAGLIRYDNSRVIGKIETNTKNGIYGTIDHTEKIYLEQMEVGTPGEIRLGDAQILCSVNGEVQPYAAEITEIDRTKKDTNKSFVIRVTDDSLLERTGGIVQGMSGSPVIQDGKFMGAVTHVFIQDSAGGYGIFAETMLNKS